MSEQYEEMFERWRQQCEQLQAKIERLQTLQPKDVTPQELEAVNDEASSTLLFSIYYDFISTHKTIPPDLVMRSAIAAVCRGMLREVGNG